MLQQILLYVDFTVSLDLQWDYCSDQLTLTCTHSEAQTDPAWVYNGTSASGVALDNIPGAEYTESTSTRHVAVISGMDNVRAVDSFTFECVYNLVNNNQVRSNKQQYYWGKLTLSCTLQSTSIYLHMQVLSCCHACVRSTICPTMNLFLAYFQFVALM